MCNNFWSTWRIAPNQYCEATLCQFIEHPFDTVTNIAFLIVGIICLRICLREKRNDLLVIPIAAFAVSIMSAFFHASGTWWGEVCDVESMYLLSSFWIARNARRLRVLYGGNDSPALQWWLYGGICLGSLILIIFEMPIGINVFILYIVLWLTLELIIGIKLYLAGISEMALWNFYKPLLALGTVFFAAYLLWWGDTLGYACVPTEHWWQYHGLWHCINSNCFYWSVMFYKQASPLQNV